MPVLATYDLRDERVDDLPFLQQLYASTCAEYRPELMPAAFALRRETIEAIFPGARKTIIEVGGMRAGEMIVARTPADIRLVDIAVLPDFRGEGIATQLVEMLCEEARRRKVPLRLTVAVDNAAAKRLYARAGFRETSRDTGYVEMEWSPAR